MIQANHLRLGNIYNRKHGKGFTATVMTEEIIGKIFTDSPEHALNDFENIKLTDALVDSVEFWEFSDYEIRYNKTDPGRHVYWLHSKSSTWAYQVTYVHQLQNIHAALYHNRTAIGECEIRFKTDIAI